MKKRESAYRGEVPTDASLIITYRCPMNCTMCQIHKNPTKKEEEIKAVVFEKLPKLKFVNITGGEPFIREDIEDIIKVVRKKTPRIVISTSGWFTEKIIALFEKYPKLGIRVSLEGLSVINDELRGRKGSFDRGLYVLLTLKKMGIRDIGFGITISDKNAPELLKLYDLAKALDMEFATAATHNSFYFHTGENQFRKPDMITNNINLLIKNLLKEKKPKSWFRAYFNQGLINYINGGKRLLPCEAGSVNFFVDPLGFVYPCNGLEQSIWKEHMGNLAEAESFESLWMSEKAESVRKKVSNCPKNCWMIGTVAPVMKKDIRIPLLWVLRNKLFKKR
ncbi:MAG: radical SAM protein [Spirochaetales bacterium]|nr:radical SAM protein [Spirochaetales bacterium]